MALELPKTLIAAAKPRMVVVATTDASGFTGNQQVQDWGGEWWEFDLTFARHNQEDGQAMIGFFAALRGVVGTFLFRPPYVAQSIAGSPVVNGAGQSGRVLQTSGWPANTTVMKAGQHIQLGANDDCRMHILTADAASNGSGAATLSIWPALRASPANGQVVIVDNPAVRLRLEKPVDINVERPVRFSFTVTAREAL